MKIKQMSFNQAQRYYRYVFVVLVYRRSEDLFDFALSIKEQINDYKVIIVNSHFDRISEDRNKEIASTLGYDFISVENKGYGFGNNRGIDYANSHYKYDFLIISNSDIVIRKFDAANLPNKSAVIGPAIRTAKGKAQNPYWVIRNRFLENCIYKGVKDHSRIRIIFARGVNRAIREIYLQAKRKSKKASKVYALHGAFILFTSDVIERLGSVYDENMFLFYEEAYLANRLKEAGINQLFYPSIEVFHKEDGSTAGLNIDLSNHARNSFLHYYENYVLR